MIPYKTKNPLFAGFLFAHKAGALAIRRAALG